MGSYYTSFAAVDVDLVVVAVKMDDIAVDIRLDDAESLLLKVDYAHLGVAQENGVSSFVEDYDYFVGKIDFDAVETELQIHILYSLDFQVRMKPAIKKIFSIVVFHLNNQVLTIFTIQ